MGPASVIWQFVFSSFPSFSEFFPPPCQLFVVANPLPPLTLMSWPPLIACPPTVKWWQSWQRWRQKRSLKLSKYHSERERGKTVIFLAERRGKMEQKNSLVPITTAPPPLFFFPNFLVYCRFVTLFFHCQEKRLSPRPSKSKKKVRLW